MFKKIMFTEMINSVYDFRFITAFTLSIIFIPLGFYITFIEYEQQLSEHDNSVSMYVARAKDSISQDIPVEGFRPPSPLAVLALGLDNHIPNKIITSRDGLISYVNTRGINNPVSLLFGEIDFLLNISIIMSLLALIYSYNIISGEKESGTLSLVLSNSISRTKLLLAKIAGSFSMLFLPLLFSIILSLFIVMVMGNFHYFQGDKLPSFILVIVFSILFVFSIFSLGTFISTLTKKSVTSIVILLLLWLMYVVAIPKLSPLIAQTIYPVKSLEVVNVEKKLLMSNLNNELNQKRKSLYNTILSEHGVDTNKVLYIGGNTTDIELHALRMYAEQRDQLEKEYEYLIANEISKIETDYRNRKQSQLAIAMNISRLSPVSCYKYIVSEFSGTGIHAIDNLTAQADVFQATVKKEIYDNYTIERYGTMDIVRKPKDRSAIQIPQLQNYRFSTFNQAFQHVWIDMVLVIIYILLFFSASYVRFLRYDVR